MAYLSVNWLAVVLAMVASMALGAAWYTGLSKQWLAATGKTIEDIQANSGGSATPFIWGAAMQLIMAYMLAVLTPAVFGTVTVGNAVTLGVHLWIGFIVTNMIMNHRYEGQKWSLAVIDGAYALGILVVQGVVIGLLG